MTAFGILLRRQHRNLSLGGQVPGLGERTPPMTVSGYDGNTISAKGVTPPPGVRSPRSGRGTWRVSSGMLKPPHSVNNL